MSTTRREQITALLRAELAAEGSIDGTDVVVHWAAYVSLHGADSDGDLPSVMTVHSTDQQLPTHIELGLLEYRRMLMQSISNLVWARRSEADDDD